MISTGFLKYPLELKKKSFSLGILIFFFSSHWFFFSVQTYNWKKKISENWKQFQYKLTDFFFSSYWNFLSYNLELGKNFSEYWKKNQLVHNWIFIPVQNECRNGNLKKPVEINRGKERFMILSFVKTTIHYYWKTLKISEHWFLLLDCSQTIFCV